MQNPYILNFKYENFPTSQITPRVFHQIIYRNNTIINGYNYPTTIDIYDDESEVIDIINNIIIDIDCKDYDYPSEYIDPDHYLRSPLCLVQPVLDHPITFNDYNNIPRPCKCSECDNTFYYPHGTMPMEDRMTKLSDNICKACVKKSVVNYFSYDYLDDDRAYYLGVCYANMTYVIPDNGYIIMRIMGDPEILQGLLSSIGIDRKITLENIKLAGSHYILLQNQQYYYDLCDIGFVSDNTLLDYPNIPNRYFKSFVSGFIRNSTVFMRGDLIYIGIESKCMARMVMDQLRLDGLECWEEYCNRMMCVVYRKK